jgi:hypothetical protein
MRSQQRGRLRIDRDPPLLARLRLLLLDADLGCALARCTISVFVARSTCRHRKALISPRRMPLTIITHKSEPQSGSPQAAAMIAAASSVLGGSGSV